MPTEPLPTSLGDGAETPDSYMETLLRQAAPDVTRRLDAIGDFVIDESNLAAMRDRQLRNPGVPSGEVDHVDHVVPGDTTAPAESETGCKLQWPA